MLRAAGCPLGRPAPTPRPRRGEGVPSGSLALAPRAPHGKGRNYAVTVLVGDDHSVAGIGQVLAGEIEGRRSPDEITVYKSIGHIVQDLASAWALYSQPE